MDKARIRPDMEPPPHKPGTGSQTEGQAHVKSPAIPEEKGGTILNSLAARGGQVKENMENLPPQALEPLGQAGKILV